MTALPRVAEIQQAVAKRYRVPVAIMTTPRMRGMQFRRYAWPRQVEMVLATRLTEHSLIRIGQFFGGRDHTTVIYAVEAVEMRRRRNPKLHHSMRVITLELVRR